MLPTQESPGLPRYRLTARAEADVVKIIRYGIETFGVPQARRYNDELTRCFELLAENPHMGRPALEFGDGVRRHGHARHVVLYEIFEEGVLVLPVIHMRSLIRFLKP
ncbi:type II toxin-antitoxin system RelE/ParE family toxin [Aliirhizobium terrae]|uniref:type II toxin-antitoxin system RelE/ParE family toxin n=1 Tax=Terrirhizobium terrae TaxID=2926709 RepID=UPI0025762B47|nr:type II toxin-antitoxin system RelE/ParE family toxin [Rhizobium sp. CC-CFT758]WJH40846.1 type II toxin-antitoxin system RelE/ParE family toxin [Rhizobium sp. CC-CFT758]